MCSTATLVRQRADKIHLNPSTGEILASQRAQELGWPARIQQFPEVTPAVLWFMAGWIVVTLALLAWWARLVTARPGMVWLSRTHTPRSHTVAQE
jgi:hypothetical protein